MGIRSNSFERSGNHSFFNIRRQTKMEYDTYEQSTASQIRFTCIWSRCYHRLGIHTQKRFYPESEIRTISFLNPDKSTFQNENRKRSLFIRTVFWVSVPRELFFKEKISMEKGIGFHSCCVHFWWVSKRLLKWKNQKNEVWNPDKKSL